MTDFDELPLEERIKTINLFAERFTEAAKPAIERLAKAFEEFGKAVTLAANSVLTDEFTRKYMADIKKENRRRRYNRMMARRK